MVVINAQGKKVNVPDVSVPFVKVELASLSLDELTKLAQYGVTKGGYTHYPCWPADAAGLYEQLQHEHT